MTTASWSTGVRHDSDATFREWGAEFAAKLGLVGLVQTADTGQINWITVTRPGVNTEAGYEIWRFNDTLQSTAPVFMRVGYGTSGFTTAPRIQITVGTGSDGAGVITGTALTIARSCNGSVGQVTDTGRQSYMCAVAGFFGFNWKTAAGASEGSFFICRTADGNGAATVTGAMVAWGSGSTAGGVRQALRFAATAIAYTAQSGSAGQIGLNPQAVTSTLVGTDLQVFLGWTITPRAEPLFGVCGVLDQELTSGGTFSATLIGTTARTFLVWTDIAGPFGSELGTNPGGLNIAMLWE